MAGKTINELDARTMPNGKENIPFQEGNTNGRLSTDALKRYVAPDLTAYQKTVDADKKYLSAVEIDDVTSIDTLWADCDTNDEESVRKSLVRELEKSIKEYDVSDHVNEFTLAGKKMWLSKEMRVGLMNSINIEKSTKKTDTVLWFEGINYTIPIDVALQMLAQLELYALSCYNVTQQHLSEVSGLSTLEELINYDYTRGYPSKLVFNLD